MRVKMAFLRPEELRTKEKELHQNANEPPAVNAVNVANQLLAIIRSAEKPLQSSIRLSECMTATHHPQERGGN